MAKHKFHVDNASNVDKSMKGKASGMKGKMYHESLSTKGKKKK